MPAAASLKPLSAARSGPLKGVARIPGDKSVSHRALILGALALGETRIENLLEADDVRATANALRALGVGVQKTAAGEWRVQGVGTGGFCEPRAVLDLGNSGTGARLLMGAMATTSISSAFTGDESLRARPMERVLNPLRRFGATHRGRREGYLPLTLTGAAAPVPIVYKSPVPSAQVKSAVLLAALNAPGETTVIEPARTRDHTERLLPLFGAKLARAQSEDGWAITLSGEADLRAARLTVPADPSSAAFPAVAALIVPGSEIRLDGVMMNETRAGLYLTLKEMGADIEISNRREESGEPVADLIVKASALTGVDVPPGRAPAMIDEYPVLCMAAALARGRTIMHGLGELRLKESNRLAALARGLGACGVKIALDGDALTVEGAREIPGGARIAAHSDHRIAMAFSVLGLAAREPIAIDDAGMIATSFPSFVSLMTDLGAGLKEGA